MATKGDIASLSSLRESVTDDVFILLGAVSWVIYTIGGTKFQSIVAIRWDILYMIIFAVIGALFCWNLENKRLGSMNSVLFMNQILVTTLTFEMIEGATFTVPELVGTFMIIASLVSTNLFMKKRTNPDSASLPLVE